MADQPHSLGRPRPSMQLIKSSTSYAEWITAELGKIALMNGEEISAQRLTLTVTALMEIEPEELSGAFERAPKELKFFPRPAEIYEIVRSERARKALHVRHSATIEDLHWIENQLRCTATVMNAQVTRETIYAMAEELIGIDQHRLAIAFDRVRQECKRFPAPADILERLPLDCSLRQERLNPDDPRSVLQ